MLDEEFNESLYVEDINSVALDHFTVMPSFSQFWTTQDSEAIVTNLSGTPFNMRWLKRSYLYIYTGSIC